MENIGDILGSVKFSMEMEGFKISKELEEEGKKVLLGELDGEEVLSKYINQAKKLGKKY